MRRWWVPGLLAVAVILSGCRAVDDFGRDAAQSFQRIGEDHFRQAQWFVDDCAREIDLLLK